MGTRFEITATALTAHAAEKAVQLSIIEIQRIESLISSWDPASQTSEINNMAGISPVIVDEELYELINRSLKISKLTQGAFDISFAAIDRLYTFDKSEQYLPPNTKLTESVNKIDWTKIVLDEANHSVFLKEKGMKLGFGGIGKGYAANKAATLMKALPGLVGGVINAAGDLMIWGENGNEAGWPIQISDPKDISKTLGWLHVKNKSVVTSGDYEKYFTHNGIRYAHIVDPKTGLPTTGIKSATIICPDAEVGDALATAIFILGKDEGLALINKLKDIEALIITDDDQLLCSKNLVLNKY